MITDLSLQEIKKEWRGSLRVYLIGYTLSLLLTIVSFGLVVTQMLSGSRLVYTLIGLALTQAAVQLIFFLHVGQEAKPRWETLVFFFMLLVLLIVVIGSLWIISDLNVRTMHD
jgi:cytochrome o ubiquinol oxidase operon protein cyoD